jgi:hypothetical protein
MRRQLNATGTIDIAHQSHVSRSLRAVPVLLAHTHMTRRGCVTLGRSSSCKRAGHRYDRKTNTCAKHEHKNSVQFESLLAAHLDVSGPAQDSPAGLPSHSVPSSTLQPWPWDPLTKSTEVKRLDIIDAPTELIFSLYKRGEGWYEEIMPHLSMQQRPIEGRKQNIDKVGCHPIALKILPLQTAYEDELG